MDQLRVSEFRRLLASSSTPCVSIYLPTTPGGVDSRGDRLKLKNALTDAESHLKDLQLLATEIKTLLAPANALLNDDAFWPNTQRGLAIWLSPTQQYMLKGPMEFRESMAVGDCFRVRPLVHYLNRQVDGYVLALSQDNVRFLRVSGDQCELLSLPGLPCGLRDALNETSVDRGAQSHSVGKSVNKKQTTVFHGQGVGHDTEKQDLGEYCRLIARTVNDYLKSERLPLVLACVESLAPFYRQANNYPQLLPEIISGSPDRLTEKQIAELAFPTFSSYLSKGVEHQLARFNDLQGSPRAITDTARIVRAAIDGHVEELFFDVSCDVWGRFDETEGVIDVHDVAAPDDHDLIELGVAETLRHRGQVYAISAENLPSPLPMAAVLRNVHSSQIISAVTSSKV
jgi:hypothetical protein